MLTLAQIASQACQVLGIEDVATQEQAKSFARLRWALLWNDQLWPQTRTVAAVTLLAGTDTVALPATMELPTLVRRDGDGTVVSVEHEVAAMLCDPDAYRAGQGMPGYWSLIEPAGGFARIRFSYAPAADLALSVVGKAPCSLLALDTDKPTIPGADLALVAHVGADLYEWQRQMGKAQAKRQEAMALQAQMVDACCAQTGQIVRLIPFDAE